MKKSLSKLYAKCILIGIALLSGANAIAQTSAAIEQDSLSIFSNTLFNVLLGIIILLIIIIAVLGNVLKNVAEATKEKRSNNNGKILSITALLLFLSSTQATFAQTQASTTISSGYMGLSPDVFFVMLTLITLEVLIISVLLNSIQIFVRVEKAQKIVEKVEPTFFEIITAAVAIDDEESILMDHDYDGIKELDNDLPPWWKYGFYVTIVFAFIYLIHFHVTQTGDLQVAEYNKTMKLAHETKEAYQKANAENVNENTVKMITDKHELDEAANSFKENCAVCHGKSAEGNIGPNLTDNYWIHGGTIKDIFTTIKYGYEDKGMKSWQAELSPLKINEIASYIKTLSGSNPANPKAPQGELFVEGGIIKSDSIKSDSTTVIQKVDSVKVMTK